MDFTSNSANQGISAAANTLKSPTGVLIVNGKLFIADTGNSRVLVFNQIPTSNNSLANLVIGQPDMSTVSAGVTQNKFSNPSRLDYDSTTGKLIIADSLNSRVLIYNQLPTTNGVAADVVVGQQDFTHSSGNQGGTVTAYTLFIPFGVKTVNGKLLVSDYVNHRILVFNSIPTTNNALADVVIGQADFTHGSANQGGSVGVNTLNFPQGIGSDGTRFFVSDANNNRILVFGSIPSGNNASANLSIGQADLIHGSINQGGAVAANTINGTVGVFAYQNQLFISDTTNHRLLIFNNIVNNPTLTLSNSPEGASEGKTRLRGSVNLDTTSLYVVQSVDVSVNGGGWFGATPTDGSFNSLKEDFFFDFDPKGSEYTVRVKATNSNIDITDNLFYFSPFNQDTPLDNTTFTPTTLVPYPTFSFSVPKQRVAMKDNLDRYQIQLRRDSVGDWKTYLDNIPIDKSGNSSGLDNVYETTDGYFVYSTDRSEIKVTPKSITDNAHSFDNQNTWINGITGKILSGNYQWKVVAVDKTGHTIESGARTLKVINSSFSSSIINNGVYFPLTLLSVTGLGNININTNNASSVKDNYFTYSTNPVFYGIAFSGAKVILDLSDQDAKCTGNSCNQSFNTTTTPDSRFGINLPNNSLLSGHKYTTSLSVSKDNLYNELPTFTLNVGSSVQMESETVATPAPTLIPSITPKEESPSPTQPAPKQKTCILWGSICW